VIARLAGRSFAALLASNPSSTLGCSRGSGHLPISNLANNVTARVRALGMAARVAHRIPSKRALEMSGALPHP
jgi:hypothetical protein